MFSDPIEAYEAIANELVSIAPKGWRSVQIVADKAGESSINTKIVYKLLWGKHKSVTEVIMIPRYLFELSKMVTTPDKGGCTKIYFSMNKKGKFDVSFDY